MTKTFNPVYFSGHETLFYIFIISMIIIMILTLIFVIKELKKKWV